MKRLISLLAALAVFMTFCGCSAVEEFCISDSSQTFSSQAFSPKKILEKLPEAIGKVISAGDTPVTDIEPVEEIEMVIDSSEFMCYTALTSTQKTIYRVLLAAADKMVSGWINVGTQSKNTDRDISLAFRAMTNDNPQIFWLPNSYLVSSKTRSFKTVALVAFSFNDGSNVCDYTVTPAQKERMQKELDNKLDEITSQITAEFDGFKTELYIHDLLCERITYNENGNGLIYTSYGALVENEAVCEGYSRAMQLICNKIGLPCALIYGTVDNTGHLWNLVNIGDGWCHLDITWDDTPELSHTYFNLNDEEISKDHTISPYYETGGDAQYDKGSTYNILKIETSVTQFNYFDYYDLLLEPDYKKAVYAISEAAAQGKNNIQLKINDKEFANLFSDDYEKYTEKLQRKLYYIRGNKVVINAVSMVNNVVMFYW